MTTSGADRAAPLPVVIVGCDDLALSLIAEVRANPDLELSAVLDDDPGQRRRIEALGLPSRTTPVPCHVLVVRDGEQTTITRPVARSFTGPAALRALPGERLVVPSADCVALRRVTAALATGGMQAGRIYLLIMEHSTRVDCLVPRFGAANDVAGWLPDDGPKLTVQRVRVPYDRSNVHVLRMDMAQPVALDAALRALEDAPLVTVGRAADGLPHTAAVQERRRDGTRPSGDAPEIFVWRESVVVEGDKLHMTVDVCPSATPVPETLDAIRAIASTPRVREANGVRS